MIDALKTHRSAIELLCQRYRVAELHVFGSAAEHDRFEPARSDIDLLVQFVPLTPAAHADAYFGLLEDLRVLLDLDIDLVEAPSVQNPYLAASIRESQVLLYAA